MKRYTLFALCLIMVFSSIACAQNLDEFTVQDSYEEGISYLRAAGGLNDSNNLRFARKFFTGGDYHPHSKNFIMYIDAFIDLAGTTDTNYEEDLEIINRVYQIFYKFESRTSFDPELEKHGLPTVGQVLEYLLGRMNQIWYYEENDDYFKEQARDCYDRLLDFDNLDAWERVLDLDNDLVGSLYDEAVALFNKGKYVEALSKFNQIEAKYGVWLKSGYYIRKCMELHEHVWEKATYTTPETCIVCGETRGKPLSTSTPTPKPTNTPTPKPTPAPTPTPSPTPKPTPTPVPMPGYVIPFDSYDASLVTTVRATKTNKLTKKYVYESSHFTNQWFDYVPEKAFDNNATTEWVEGSKSHKLGDYVGCVWSVNDSSLAAYGVAIKGGMQHSGETSWARNQRPKEITVTVNGREYYFTMADKMDEQVFYFGDLIGPNSAGELDVRVKITDTYLKKTSDGYNVAEYNVAITEIDLICAYY